MKPEPVKREDANFKPDLTQMCRLCLAENRGVIDIFDASRKLSVPMRIMACTSLEVQLKDSLPKKICQDCRVQLERFYYFRKLSQLSDAKLRKHIRLISAGKRSRVFQSKIDEDEDDDDENEFSDSLAFLKEVDRENDEKQRQERIELEESLIEKFRQEETDRIFDAAKQFFNMRTTKKVAKKTIKVEMNQGPPEETTARGKSSDVSDDTADQEATELVYSTESLDEQYYMFKTDANQEENDDEQHKYNDMETDDRGSNEGNVDLDEYTIDIDEEDKEETMEMETLDLPTDDGESNDDNSAKQNEDTSSLNDEASDNSNTNIFYELPAIIKVADENNDAKEDVIEYDEQTVIEADNLGDKQPNDHTHKINYADLIETNMPRNSEKLKIFKCLECPQAFSNRAQLLRHSSVHERVHGYQCSQCKKWFACKSSLDRHIRVHTGEKPFKCEICHRRFIQKEILKRHMTLHTGDKPYSCPMCDKKFVQKQLLNQHINQKHSENPVVQMHECLLCPKSFRHASGLSRHLLIHSGISYTCKICFKKFSDKSAIKRHTSTVH